MPKSGKRILLGEIKGAHGIRGDVLVRTFTSEPETIASYGPLESEDGTRTFDIGVRRVTSKGVVATVAGVEDRTAAEQLNGTRLYAYREQLPEAAPGEYYYADLIGAVATDARGTPWGTVVAIVNYGAGDLIEVRPEGLKSTELIPFIESFVRDVDLDRGRLVVERPKFAGDDEDAE